VLICSISAIRKHVHKQYFLHKLGPMAAVCSRCKTLFMVKVRLSLHLTKHHAMKMHQGVEVQLFRKRQLKFSKSPS